MPEADPLRELRVDPGVTVDPDVGRALWRLDDARRRMLATLDGITPGALDWAPPWPGNTIGSVLYHLAAIEADYLCSEILGLSEPPPDVMAWFPYDVRDDGGILTPVRGFTLAEHLARLDAVRERLRATLAEMSAGDFRRARTLASYEATPEWVLHHLTQHDAEHRGQIGELRLAAERAQ